MAIYVNTDEFYLNSNQVYIDVSFVTPGYREGKYIQTFYNKDEIFKRIYSIVEKEILQLSRTVGGVSVDDLNFIHIPIIINEFGSDECEYKVHIYFDTKYESIAKAFEERLQKDQGVGYIFEDEKIIISDIHLGYFYKSYDDIRATLADDKTVELEKVRKESKEWQRKYERLLNKCKSFASDINREV